MHLEALVASMAHGCARCSKHMMRTTCTHLDGWKGQAAMFAFEV